jgi:valyl-tRNA synthetase
VQGLIARAIGSEKPAPVPWEQLDLADRWILAEYAQVVQGATAGWEGYDYTRAVKDTESFLWHVVADHYLELVKHRIDKPGTRHTLYTIGLGILKLMAPVLCFATEDLYQEIYRKHEGHKSIHVAPWPEAPRADASVIPEGAVLRDVVAAIRNWKSQSKLALNQALPALEVVATDPRARHALEQGKADLRGTVHVADVHFVDAKEVMMVPTGVEPVHAKLGPKFRQDAKAVADAVKAMDATKAGPHGIEVVTAGGATFRLEPGEYEIRSRPTLHGSAVDALDVGGVTLLLRKP